MADYKNAHLLWIRQTKNFVPKFGADYVSGSYYEVMEQLYSNRVRKFLRFNEEEGGIEFETTDEYSCSQKEAEQFFLADQKHYLECLRAMTDISKSLKKVMKPISHFYFVTIGFNHQTWSVAKCVTLIEKILARDWIIQAKANFELFRENGEHPHVHFYLESEYAKSTIVEKIFRPSYVRELVLKKNFVDCKIADDVHLNYIKLIKRDEKMPYVVKDIEWRNKNKIPDFEKNWKL